MQGEAVSGPPTDGRGGTPPGEIRAVVFDYGGVLTSPVGRSIARWTAADRIEPESFSRTIKRWLSRSVPHGTPVHRLETGHLPVAEFERLLAAELTTTDGSAILAEGLLGRVFAATELDEPMIGLVRELRGLGLSTVLLSNSWGNRYPMALLDEIFDPVVISGDVGLRKPDPRIYRLALEPGGISPGQAVFIDDAEPNTEAAAALGMHTVLHTDPATTRARLRELIPALAGQPRTEGHTDQPV